MTSEERLLAALRMKEVDHTPCCPTFWIGSPKEQAFKWSDTDHQLAYVINGLGADARLSFGIDSEPPPQKTWKEPRPGEGYDILHAAIETPGGELRSSVRMTDDYPHPDIPLFSDWTMSRFGEPWIKSREDVEKFTSVYLPPTDEDLTLARERLVALEGSRTRWRIPIIGHGGFGLNGVIHTMGAQQGVLIGVDAPELLDTFLGTVYRRQKRILEMMLDLGVTTIVRNGWYDSTDFWSPSQFERWIAPQLATDIEMVHQAGGIFIYQMCTGIRPLLPALAELDFDCLLEFEPALDTVHSAEIKAALPGKSFWGGVSAPVHLEGGNEEAVRKAVRDAFSAFGREGFILKAVPSIRAHLPKENIAAFFDEWRRLILRI